MSSVQIPSAEQTKSRIEYFKEELLRFDNSSMVERHIFCADAFVTDKDNYFLLKRTIARFLNVAVPNVVMVGSGKLGFSIAPDQRYQPFNDESDLDMAVISSELFDKLWKEVFLRGPTFGDWPNNQRFFEHISQGWIRPDLFPPRYLFGVGLWDFLRSLERSEEYGPYQIRIALYKDWDFLRSYQVRAIKACREI